MMVQAVRGVMNIVERTDSTSSEHILSPEFDMGHLSLEDIYPDDVAEFGHMRVGMTDLYAKENHALYGVVTRGECRELTSRLLRDEAVQMIITAKLATLPEDYDPWIRRIERNRALHLRYGDKFDPWEKTDSPHVQSSCCASNLGCADRTVGAI